MKRICSSDIQEQWYYFLLHSHGRVASVHSNVDLKSVIHQEKVEFLWIESKFGMGFLKDKFFSMHFDIVVADHISGEILFVHEVNGSGHGVNGNSVERDYYKLLFCILGGINFVVHEKFPRDNFCYKSLYLSKQKSIIERIEEDGMKEVEWCRLVLLPQERERYKGICKDRIAWKQIFRESKCNFEKKPLLNKKALYELAAKYKKHQFKKVLISQLKELYKKHIHDIPNEYWENIDNNLIQNPPDYVLNKVEHWWKKKSKKEKKELLMEAKARIGGIKKVKDSGNVLH